MLGTWLGVYPTIATIGAQIAAAAFVIGSCFLARGMKVKRLRRKTNARSVAPPPVVSEPERELPGRP